MITLCVTLLLAATSLEALADTRPNIIWLQTDSQDGRMFDPTDSVYFQKLKLTSFKDVLIDNGITFTRHYTNSPQCVPSRTSMMTGRYVHETHTSNNGQGIAKSPLTGKLDSNCISEWSRATCEDFAATQQVNDTIISIVANAGYDMHLFGRFDIGAGVIDENADTSGDGFHGGPSLDILARGAALPGTSKGDPWLSTRVNDKWPYEGDVIKRDKVVDFLQNHDPQSSKPYFLHFGILSPHPPYATNATYMSHVDPDAPDVPPVVSEIHPFDLDQSIMKNCDHNYTDHQIKTMRMTYWGACAQAADLLFSVFQTAKQTGHLNNTIVILTSDHGEMSLEHDQDFKNSMYEPSSRVPLIVIPVNVPNMVVPSGGIIIKNLTSHIDLLPTIAEIVGAETPESARGLSLMPFLLNQDTKHRPPRNNYVAIEYHSNLGNTGSFGLRQGPFKLITYAHTYPWFASFEPQLFNVDADPYELKNIAANNSAIVASMTQTLEAEFGGPGAIARIDSALMGESADLYRQYFHELCTPTELVNAFMKTFKGSTNSTIVSRVTEWSGLNPLQAQGPGKKCPQGGDGIA